MSNKLTFRLASDEKAGREKSAADASESLADYVRKAVRESAQGSGASPWDKHIGSADVAVDPPTNTNIRRAFDRP